MVALGVFAYRLDWTLAVVTFFVVFAYGAFRLSSLAFVYTLKGYIVIVSVVLTRWRTRLRRAMNDRDAVRSYHLSPFVIFLSQVFRSRAGSIPIVYSITRR